MSTAAPASSPQHGLLVVHARVIMFLCIWPQNRTVVSATGCLCVEGFTPSPRHGSSNEKQWLVITVDFTKAEMPVHFLLETSSQVDTRKRSSTSSSHHDIVAVIGIVRFLGGECARHAQGA